MFPVNFYSFKKKLNSTALPSGSGTTLYCEIDEPCSIKTPVLKLTKVTTDTSNPPLYNYARIELFERYYFIDNWEYNHGLWYAYLISDPMGSARSNIGGSSFYVLRSSNKNEDSLMDSMYPTEAGYFMKNTSVELVQSEGGLGHPVTFGTEYNEGCYIIGIINNELGTNGAVSYYYFPPNNFRTFMQAMLTTTDWMNIEAAEISADLVKILYNPLQYIVSCKWYPFTFNETSLGAAYNTLKFGFWELQSGTFYRAPSNAYFYGEAEIPKHPQAESQFSYLNLQPFTRYFFNFYTFGEIPIDTTLSMNYEDLFMSMRVDCRTGDAVLGIGFEVDRTHPTIVRRSMVGVDVPLGQISTNVVGTGLGIVNTIAGAVTGNMEVASAGIKDTFSSALPQFASQGSQGSSVDFYLKPYLQGQFMYQTRINNDDAGRPLCNKVQISTIPGYVKCENAHIRCDLFESEIAAIDSYLNGGFYYE